MEDGKKAAVVIGVGAGLAGLAYALTRPAEAKPPPPPPGKANLYGVVTNAETGAKIKDVLVSLNGYSTITNPAGYYQFADLEPGGYVAEFSKEGYLTEVF